MHRRARVRPGGDPVPAGNYGTGLCVLAGPVEGGYNKINSRAPPQRPGAVRGGRFSRGPGGAMDRIELIRRLNGVLLDEMPAYRDRAAGFPDDLRSAVYHEKIPAARDFACKENSGQNTSAKKTDWANAQSAFFVFASAVTVRLEFPFRGSFSRKSAPGTCCLRTCRRTD